jgi:hypothetical protein
LLNLTPTINQTGGANGITRGLYINPTLTAAADFRGIEVSNCGSHKALVTGTGPVNFGDYVTTVGALGVGTGAIAPGARMEISHTVSQMLRLNNPSTAASGVGGRLDGYNVLDYISGIFMGFSGGTAVVNRKIDFYTGGDSATPKMSLDGLGSLTLASTSTASGSIAYGLQITRTYNQTSTAGSTDLLINRTDTALGSGTHLFADFQLAGVTKLSFTRSGGASFGGNLVFPGTAITRTIQFGDSYNDGSSLIIANGATTIGTFSATGGFVTGLKIQASGTITTLSAFAATTTFNATSGTATSLTLSPTFNQSGTAGSTDLLISRNETSLGSGTHNFIDCRTPGTSRFSVSNTGTMIATAPVGVSVTPPHYQQWTIEFTSNTAGNIVYRGTDGTTRRFAFTVA